MDLRTKLFTLTELDIIVVFLNKYIQFILNSALFFVLWQRCFLGNIKEGIIIQIIIVLSVYHMLLALSRKVIRNYLKKHKLDIFITD